jgi:serine/threonine protein kinase/WD40 repeat protein
MDPARWERLKAVFHAALEGEPSARTARLDAACGSDAALRAEVEALLRAHAGVAGPLDSPPVVRVEPEGARAAPPGPSRIGAYRILRELGRGGMGTVYLAERDEPGLRKTVAVKVVRRGMDSAFVVGRFRTERQILAALEHPGIARLYDGGTTDEGLPFFVMEYVDGEDLLRHCDGRRLPIAARLELFVRVCEAVQYAHQRLVVHRDLKPTNVLVAASGQPKLLDFGIAKLLVPQRGDEGADETASVIRLMTPDYASPEQVRGERVTTASDVYSLGVILYELLSGHRPYRLKRRATGEIEREIAERDVDPPSAALARTEKVTTRGDAVTTVTPAEVATNRQATPGKLRRRLRGDLDNLALKALSKEQAGRYATAAELADDIRRYLDGFPVRARAADRTYRAAKFLRRHRTGAAAAGLVLLSLLSGLAVARHQTQVARGALAESLLAQARFQRATGRVGQRFETLALVQQAVGLVPRRDRAGTGLASLRTEAAGALALPDLKTIARWPVFVGHYETEIDFTPDLEHYAAADPAGGFAVFATADRRALKRFPGAPDNPALRFQFSPDARWLAATFQDGSAEIHSLATDAPPRRWPGTARTHRRTFVAFSPEGAAVVSIEGRGAVWHDLADGRERLLLSAADRPEEMAFDSTGERLAVSNGSRCAVWRVADGAQVWSRTLNHRVSELAWSPDGRHLAAGAGRSEGESGKAEFGVSLLAPRDGTIETAFIDHQAGAGRLAFHPDGGSFVSLGWDGRLVWRARRADGFRLVGDGSPRALRFSRDGKRMAFSPTHEELALAEVAPPAVYRLWWAGDPVGVDGFTMALSPDGAVLATAAERGIHLWDTAAGEESSLTPLPAPAWWMTVWFHPDGRSLIYSAESFGVRQAELIRRREEGGHVRFALGRQRIIHPGPGVLALNFAPDGRSLLVAESRRQDRNDRVRPTVWLWPDMDPARAHKVAGDFPLVGYRLVAGGRWGVSTDNVGRDVWVWDPRTGQRVRSLGIPTNVFSMSSRDTRWLITRTRDESVLWDTFSWQAVTRWPARAGQHFDIAGQFSPDASLFGTADLGGQIEIRALPHGRVLLSLPPPQVVRVQDFRFSTAGDRLYLERLDGALGEWDLGRLRGELAKLELDWN